MTRRVISGLFASVDGVVSAPNTFQFDSFDDVAIEAMVSMLGRIDETIMGRTTYCEWAPYWPTATDPYAEFINPIRKWVASTTLKDSDMTWNNSALIAGNLSDFVAELKETDGGDIAIQGSISVVRELVRTKLIDEITLIVHPVFAGSGLRLSDGLDTTRLSLESCVSTPKGNVIASYSLR